LKRQVKSGYVRTPGVILGSPQKIIEFTLEVRPGLGVSFNQQMAAWAFMRLAITLIPHECSDADCPWKYHGTIDGSSVYRFLEEWVEIVAEGEVEEDDLRVRKLIEDIKEKGNPPPPFLRLLGGM
jgi:hypothetical protein